MWNQKLDHIDQLIANYLPIAPEQLGGFRILYCLLILFFIGFPNYSWVAEHPAYIYNPPRLSLAYLFNDFPHWLVLEGLSLLTLILFLFLLFGFHTKKVSILLTLVMLIGHSFAYSFGKIDHSILYVIFPIMMAFSGWGSCYSIDAKFNRKNPKSSWAIPLVCLVTSFAMFTAGVPKLLGGWLDLSTQAVQGHFIVNYFSVNRDAFLASFFIKFNQPVFWELLDYLAVIFELGFLLAFLKPSIFRFFIFLAVCFHLINGLIFNIFFIGNYVVYLLFISPRIFEKLGKSIAMVIARYFTLRILMYSLVLLLTAYVFIQYRLPFSEALLFPSILKIVLYPLTDQGELIISFVIAMTAFLIGIYACISYALRTFIAKKKQN